MIGNVELVQPANPQMYSHWDMMKFHERQAVAHREAAQKLRQDNDYEGAARCAAMVAAHMKQANDSKMSHMHMHEGHLAPPNTPEKAWNHAKAVLEAIKRHTSLVSEDGD